MVELLKMKCCGLTGFVSRWAWRTLKMLPSREAETLGILPSILHFSGTSTNAWNTRCLRMPGTGPMYSITQSPSANGREVNDEKDKVLSNISHLTQQLHFSSFPEEPQLRYVHGSLLPNFRSVLQHPFSCSATLHASA